jgi:hypothetical protein
MKDDTTFKKFDDGKAPLAYLFHVNDAIGEVAKVIAYGANKYGNLNWKNATSIEDVTRLESATLRHLFANEKTDVESGLLHRAHAITSQLFLLQMEIEGLLGHELD